MPFDNGHALVIGIGTYDKTPGLTVPVTAEDALQVAQVLVDPRTCAYPAGQVQLLTNSDATRAAILAALDALAANTTADDTVLVFYSGHGMYGADGYYLTASDTEVADGKVVTDSGIRETELLERLNRIPARRALLVFNACHSGAIAPGALSDQQTPAPAGTSLPDELTTALLGTGEGRVVITACREAQFSYYDYDLELTYFAQSVVDALQGRGITSRRGAISVFDLYDYVYHTVNGEVRRRWKREQEPVLTVHQGIGAMAVALFRGRTAEDEIAPTERPANLGGAVREVTPEASQAALQQIISGERNLAAGRDITGNTIVDGDQIKVGDISGSSGIAIGRAARSDVRNVNTGGGEYAEGDIDNRTGAFVSGGKVYGPVVGTNSGTISTDYDLGSGRPQQSDATLRTVRQKVRQAIDEAAAQGNTSLAAELDGIEQLLGSAIQAEGARDAAQRTRKLRQAKGDLNELASRHTALRGVAELLVEAQ